jgi:hypothetical protein
VIDAGVGTSDWVRLFGFLGDNHLHDSLTSIAWPQNFDRDFLPDFDFIAHVPQFPQANACDCNPVDAYDMIARKHASYNSGRIWIELVDL